MFFNRRKEQPDNALLIRDMIVEMQIGAYDDERGKTQKVRINIVAEPSIWPDASHDNLNETISYDMIVQHVWKVTRAGHIHLAETVAERIAAACLTEPAIRKVTVRVEKLEIYPFAIPGVEIVRAKA